LRDFALPAEASWQSPRAPVLGGGDPPAHGRRVHRGRPRDRRARLARVRVSELEHATRPLRRDVRAEECPFTAT